MLFNAEYYHAPPREIDQAIVWLQDVIADCELKIRKLEALKNSDLRQERHRQNMNDLADLFDDPDFYNIDLQNQIEIIRQRIGGDYKRARDIHALLLRKKKRRDKRQRHTKILQLHRDGLTPTEIAKQSGVSRQTVYTVINKGK